jgi:heat-inducible transcriptional repressor
MKGIIGVIGPKRMDYDFVAPQIKYFSSLIEEIVKNQGM